MLCPCQRRRAIGFPLLADGCCLRYISDTFAATTTTRPEHREPRGCVAYSTLFTPQEMINRLPHPTTTTSKPNPTHSYNACDGRGAPHCDYSYFSFTSITPQSGCAFHTHHTIFIGVSNSSLKYAHAQRLRNGNRKTPQNITETFPSLVSCANDY